MSQDFYDRERIKSVKHFELSYPGILEEIGNEWNGDSLFQREIVITI